MGKALRYALLSGAAFLALHTVGVQKPGLPLTLKADEPAYFLMTSSLALDGDLRCDERDYRRLLDTFPYLPVENLILMSDDGGETVFFAKPYIYSLLTAPLAALLGANGMIAFNALLLALMIVLGTLYLGRFNSRGAAALFSSAFFLLSPAFVYVFWLQPEILNMASAAGCLFFAFHRFTPGQPSGWARRWLDRCFNASTAPAWSAVLLSLGTYNKPVLALLGLPALLAVARRRGARAVAAWIVAATLAMGAIVVGSIAFCGHATPYLGSTRTGVRVESVEEMDEVVREALALTSQRSTTGNTWSWMFRLPQPAPGELTENLRYFLIGRHVGLLPYYPFSALCLLLFLLHRRRSPERWLTIVALAATALFYLLTIPLNWHGGGGFAGNRYFAMAYPAFLFLTSSLRPLWLVPATVAAGSTLLGPLLLTPFGAPVLEPTLQAHVRNPLFRAFPFELSLRSTIPGYDYLGFPKATFIGRRDVFRAAGPDEQLIWIHGATRVDLLLMTDVPIEGVFFEVESAVPDNTVRLEMAGHVETLEFVAARNRKQRTRLLELRPRRIDQRHVDHLTGKRFVVYDISIAPRTGRRIEGKHDPSQVFYLGARVRFLGRRDQVGRVEHYRLSWLELDSPTEVEPGEHFTVTARIRNDGQSPLSSDAHLPVLVGYRWLDEKGAAMVDDGRRSRLESEVAPGSETSVVIEITAPTAPGRYRLVLDAVREPVAWFSEKGNATYEQLVEVEDPGASISRDSPEP